MPTTVTPEQNKTLWDMLKLFERSMRPATVAQTSDLIVGLMRHYFVLDANVDGILAVVKDWCSDLSAFEAQTIQQACDQWRRSHKRKPTPAELIELCHSLDERPMLIERLRRAVKIPTTDAAPRPDDPKQTSVMVNSWSSLLKLQVFAKDQGIEFPTKAQSAYLFEGIEPDWWVSHMASQPQEGEAPPLSQAASDALQRLLDDNPDLEPVLPDDGTGLTTGTDAE